jgi:hypothetical protein
MSPSVSRKQAIAMNLANAIQKGEIAPKAGTPSAQIAKSMPPGKMGDFAGPIPAGLPKKVAAPPGTVPRPSGSKEKAQDVVGGKAMPWGYEAPKAVNVGGPGPGRPGMKVKNVGKPVKKMRF